MPQSNASPSGSRGAGGITLRGLLRLGGKTLILFAAVMATLAGITFLVPDKNDYALITLQKHKRLAEYDTRKIVLIGGSNLAFGVDSPMIQRATGCPVVNMGINGYLGVRYMLEEVKSELKPKDIVVLAFEWDNFYKSVDGTSRDQLALAKVNLHAFAYLTFKQKMGVIAAIPLVAQEKTLRLISDVLASVTNTEASEDEADSEDALVAKVESLGGFTPEGDLVSHLGIPWPYERENGIIPKGKAIESEMITMMRDFAAEMAKRDVSVMVSYTPAIRYFYDANKATIDEAHARITATPPLVAPSPPSAFVYDEAYFFDTVYHLNAEGRPLRTRKLIEDLQSSLHERTLCPPPAPVTAATGAPHARSVSAPPAAEAM